MILEDGGYSVDAYNDPHTALSKFRPNYYDMAVLDYIMPDLNGLDLYRRIREIDPRIRCSILTATHEKFSEDEDNPQGQGNLRGNKKTHWQRRVTNGNQFDIKLVREMKEYACSRL